MVSHSIQKLILKCLAINVEFQQLSLAKSLDRYFIPTRYPSGLPDQIPHEFYQKEDAMVCVYYAEKTLSLIKTLTGRQ